MTNFTINQKPERTRPIRHDDALIVQTALGVTQKLYLHNVTSGLPGVLELKAHVAKIDNSLFSVAAGAAKMRKTDNVLYDISWNAIASVSVATLNGAALNPGELRWIVWQWNPGETGIELKLLPTLPISLAAFDRITLIGRLWNTAGTLFVSALHQRQSVHEYETVSQVGWSTPAINMRGSVRVSPYSNPAFLAVSAGELARWPVVSDLVAGRHTFDFPGIAQLTAIWGHLKATAVYDNITDCSAANLTTYIDTGAGTPTAMAAGKYAVHRLGLYAGSNEKVWFRGQAEYGSLAEAVAARETEAFTYATWADDARQIAPIAYIISRKGETTFATAGTYCTILPWTKW